MKITKNNFHDFVLLKKDSGNLCGYFLKILFLSSILFFQIDLNSCTAQSYIMSNGTISTCGGTFYDSGGSGGDYTNGETIVETFCSSIAGQCIEINFSSFMTEAGWDILTAYDGPNTGSPIIGSWDGTLNPGPDIIGTSGCITFEWSSDLLTGVYSGWAATITCITCPQIYTISNGSISTCSGLFYDSGGPSGNYGNNENFIQTICTSTPGLCIKVAFSAFQTQAADVLTVYDGNSTAGILIGTYSGNLGAGMPSIVSSSGCLTFQFISNGNTNQAGWQASISCVNCPEPPILNNGCGCTNCPVILPDDLNTPFVGFLNVGGATFNTLGGNNCLQQICLDVTHDFIGDLDITLVAPDGTSVVLFADGNQANGCPCGNAGDNIQVCFTLPGMSANGSFAGAGGTNCTDPNFFLPCNGGLPCYTGTWEPFSQPCGSGGLDAFNNGTGTVNGVWQLIINDNALLNQGILNDFYLVFCDTAGLICQSIGCGAYAGTTTTTATGSGTNPYILCPGDAINITSNNDFTLPDPGCATCIPELMYAIYTNGGPTTNDPATDPTWTGYYWTGQDFVTGNAGGLNINNTGSASALSAIIPSADNTWCFVPITADDGDNDNSLSSDHDQDGDGCFDMGTPICFTYLNPITFSPTVNCGGSVSVQINGGYPEFFPANYTITNTGAGILNPTSIPNGGTVNITGLTSGQTYSFSVNDGNGCTQTFSGIATSGPTANITPSVTSVCQNGCVNLTGNSTSGVNPGNVTFTNSNDVPIPDGGIAPNCNGGPVSCAGTWASSVISVSGVCPGTWNTGQTLIICLDINHTYDEDLNIFVQAPNGNIVRLSQDNGLGGNNYTGTCFTMSAATNITAGAAPFNGSYIPQQSFNALFNGTAINGNWILWIGDDVAIDAGTLLNWSITFTNQSANTYAWLPAAGLSATNILSPVACPAASTTYTLTVTNSCGCTATATSAITVLPPPVINVPASAICNGTSAVLTASGALTYTWSPLTGLSATTGSSVNANPATTTTYTVTGTAVGGCTGSTTVVVSVSNANIITLESVDITCGRDNGEAAVDNISGGGGPFTYLWSTGETTIQIQNLTPGTYSVTVTNTAGCTSTASVTLGSISFPVLSETHVNTTCGNANGSIDVSVAGGIAPFSYLWSTGGTSEDLNFIGAGNYSVTITDANGCTDDISVLLTNLNGPTLSFTSVDVACSGFSTGSINLTVNGGVAPFTYAWSNGETTQDISVLPAGLYTVVVTDNNGCIATAGIIIANGIVINLPFTQIDVNCFGAGTGSINLSVSGGTAPIFYLWSNGATTQDLTNLSAGIYTVSVTDGNGCTATTPATITQPAPLNFLSVITNAGCTINNGAINITVTGGNTPYSFSWSNGFTTEDISNLAAGNYSVTILDATFCSYTWSGTVTSPTPQTLSETHINATCGLANGSIDLTVAGGTAPFIYSWSNGITTQDLTNIAAGNYTVTVTDNNGCTATLPVTLFNSNGAALSETHIDATCGLANGSIDLTIVGGTSPFIYSWSNGATTEDLTNIAAGNYTVTVTDNNGCTATLPVTLFNSNGAALSETHINATCGLSNGSIDLTVAGGTAPFIYSWSNGATTEDLTNIVAGNYTVTVTDNNGCTATLPITITDAPAQTLSETHINATCGLSNGSIDLTVAGGTAPFIYSWSNGTTTEDITNIAAGNYTVTVTDNNGCTATLPVTITDAPAQTLSETHVDATCGLANGSIDLTVAGGTAPFIYSWSNGITTQDLTNIAAGNYTVTVTDNNGCTATLPVTLFNSNGATLSETHINSTCGLANGSIDLTIVGGTSPFNYSWSNGATTQDLTNIAAGNYTVTVTDNNGCTATLPITITDAPSQTLSETHINATCGLANGSIDLTVAGGTAPFNYSWSNGATTEDLTNIAAGNYTVTVTDNNGCTATLPVTITDAPSQILSETHVDATCGVANGSIDLTVAGGTAPFIYSWSNGATTEDLTNIAAGNYTVTVTDNNGCTATLTITMLNIGNPTTFLQVENICLGQNFVLPDGSSVSVGGIYIDTVLNSNNCDSIITTNLTVNPLDNTSETLTSCDPANVGVVVTTYTNQYGCDSVHTVTTTFLLSDSTFQNLTSCNPADTGIVSTTYTNQFGCDSVHTVITTYLLSDSTFQNLTSCNPADTGIVSTTYTNQFGCDSVHTIITTYLLSDSTFQNLTSCNPADTGIVLTTYTNQFGCDSVHTVITTYLLSDSTFQNLTSCNPADTGIVSTTYTNQFGCDSVQTVTTTFLLSDSTFQNLTSCNPSDTGIVSTTYTNQFGCDSVHTVITTY